MSEDFPTVTDALLRIADELRRSREQAAELHADHMRKADEADEKRARAADADTDKRIGAARADLEEYAGRIGAVMLEHDVARKAMQEEIDQLRSFLNAHGVGRQVS